MTDIPATVPFGDGQAITCAWCHKDGETPYMHLQSYGTSKEPWETSESVALRFWCEFCPGITVHTFNFHKGQTLYSVSRLIPADHR